jgi:hypothetical protein
MVILINYICIEYKHEIRGKTHELFKNQAHEEKIQMKNDPVELQQTIKDIKKSIKNKGQEIDEIDGFSKYKSEVFEKERK